MILYEVALEVSLEVQEEFRGWLPGHIEEILKIDGFQSAKLWEEEGNDKLLAFFRVQYFLKDRISLQSYLDHHAARMRADGINRFGNKFKAKRSTACLIGSFERKN